MLAKLPIEPSTPWETARPQLEKQPEFEAITQEYERARIYKEYMKDLEESCSHSHNKRKKKSKKSKKHRRSSSVSSRDSYDDSRSRDKKRKNGGKSSKYSDSESSDQDSDSERESSRRSKKSKKSKRHRSDSDRASSGEYLIFNSRYLDYFFISTFLFNFCRGRVGTTKIKEI